MRIKLLTPLLPAAAVAATLAFPGPAAANSCIPVSVDTGGVGGEEGAYAITTRNLSCGPARRLVRIWLKTGDAPGAWAVRTNPRSFTIYKGKRQVTFKAAS